MEQGLGLTGDLKLGRYMHIPPIMMFWVQVLATIWGGLVNVAILYWSYANIRGICTPGAVQGFVSPGATTFFTASVVWVPLVLNVCLSTDMGTTPTFGSS